MFYISAVAEETKADIEAINNLYETSPMHKLLLNTQIAATLLQFFLVPAAAMATYFYFRRKTKQLKMDAGNLVFFVNFAVMVLILDIFNNLALLFGRMV